MSKRIPVHVVDQIMGSGKSTEFMEIINKQCEGKDHRSKDCNRKYLIIVPTLPEVQRYVDNCPNADFKQPETSYDGQIEEYQSKKKNLMRLLLNGNNIVSTHSMYGLIDESIAQEIFNQEYYILIDECLSCLEPLTLTNDMRDALLDSGYISINKYTKRVRWSGPMSEPYYGPLEYISLRSVLLTKEVFMYRDNLLVFQIPKIFFSCGKCYTILTYRFEESSNMWLYFQLNGIDYNINKVADTEAKERFKELITIVDSPSSINNIKQRYTTFSINWWNSRTAKECATLRNTIGKCLSRRDKVDKRDMLYACTKAVSTSENALKRSCHVTPKGYSGYMENIKDEKTGKIIGKAFSPNFISFNINATNQYANKNYIIYMSNVFLNVSVANWMDENGFAIDKDTYALSIMLQAIWRTAIRNKDPIRLMIFSNRMKKLFTDWLDSCDRGETVFYKREVPGVLLYDTDETLLELKD